MFSSIKSAWMRGISIILLGAFLVNTLFYSAPARAQMSGMAGIPMPGARVVVSPSFEPVMIKGVVTYPDQPLKIGFLIDKSDSSLSADELRAECSRLIRYFFAALTVPEKDVWVNLSPYEKDRMIPQPFSQTEMGEALLAQDYILKQLAASLTYPDADLGKDFWQEVYRRAGGVYDDLNTINKVWVVPSEAEVYVQGNSAMVVSGRMNVMMDKDYVALAHEKELSSAEGAGDVGRKSQTQEIYENVFRERILPEIGRDINQGKQFAALRQVYNAMVLATWFKKNLRENFLNKIYTGKNTVNGIDLDDKYKEELYSQYLESLKKGAYNYIKEEYDPGIQDTVPVKHFSGGIQFTELSFAGRIFQQTSDPERGRMVNWTQPLMVDVGMLLDEKSPGMETLRNAVSSGVASGTLALKGMMSSPVVSQAPAAAMPYNLPARGQVTFTSPAATKVLDILKLSVPEEKPQPFWKRWSLKKIAALTVFIGAIFSTGTFATHTQAATFYPDNNGGVVAVVEAGDTAGHILETIRVTYDALDREGYQSSALKGDMWGAKGVINNKALPFKHIKSLKAGTKLVFSGKVLSSSVVEGLISAKTAAGPGESQPSALELDHPQTAPQTAGLSTAPDAPPPVVSPEPKLTETQRDESIDLVTPESLTPEIKVPNLSGIKEYVPSVSLSKLVKIFSGEEQERVSADEALVSAPEEFTDPQPAEEESVPAVKEATHEQESLGFSWSFPDAKPYLDQAKEFSRPYTDKVVSFVSGLSRNASLGWMEWVTAAGLFFITAGRWASGAFFKKKTPPENEKTKKVIDPMGDRERRHYIRREINKHHPLMNEAGWHGTVMANKVIELFHDQFMRMEDVNVQELDATAREQVKAVLGEYFGRAIVSKVVTTAMDQLIDEAVREFAVKFRDLPQGQEELEAAVKAFIAVKLEPTVRTFLDRAIANIMVSHFSDDKVLIYRQIIDAEMKRYALFDGNLPIGQSIAKASEEIRQYLEGHGLKVKPGAGFITEDADDLLAEDDQPKVAKAKNSNGARVLWQEDSLAAVYGLAAAWAGGFEPGSLWLTTGLAPVVYRFGLVLSQWIHELGHTLKGGAQALTRENLQGNVSLKAWLWALVPFFGSVPKTEVRVYDTTASEDKRIRRAGFWTSLVIAAGQMFTVGSLGAGAVPLMFPFGLGAWWVLLQSGKTDIWDQMMGNIRRGVYYCGVVSMVRARRDGDKGILSETAKKMFKKMGAITDIRGQQAAGFKVMAKDKKGNVSLIGRRMVNPKRGNLPNGLDHKLNSALKTAASDGLKNVGPSETILAHYRFGTSSAPAVNETHPHQWMPERGVSVWQVDQETKEVRKVEKTLAVSIGHNGDFDYFRIYDQWVSNEIMGLWLERVLQTPNDTKGDSPKIAGVMDLMLTQGIWPAAVRWAYYDKVAVSIEEAFGGVEPAKNAPDTSLPEAVINRLGSIFEEEFEKAKPYITPEGAVALNDFWVTEQTAGKDPARLAQAERIAKFEAQMVQRLAGIKLCQGWGEDRLKAFVRQALESFFDNDLYMTVRKFFDRVEHSNNTFGLVVGSTLKTDGLVLAARGQPMTMGVNEEIGLTLAASEPLAVRVEQNGEYVTDRFALDQRHRGEIVEVSVDGDNPKKRLLKVYSRDLNRELTDSELEARYEEMPPEKNNPYITPLQEPEKDDPVGKDVRDIPAVLESIKADWEKEDSLNRQTADEFLLRFVQKALERQIKKTSVPYAQIPGHLTLAAQELIKGWEEILGGGRYRDLETGIRPLMQRYLEGVVARSFERSRIDESIRAFSLELAQNMASGKVWEDKAYVQMEAYIKGELTALIDDEWRASAGRIAEFEGRIKEYVSSKLKLGISKTDDMLLSSMGPVLKDELRKAFKEMGVEPGIPNKKDNHDLVIIGIESSLWVGEQFGYDLNLLFPDLRVKAVSANKVLESPEELQIGPETIILCVSQSGQTFGSLNTTILLNGKEKDMSFGEIMWRATEKLDTQTEKNVFVLTGELDTLMGRAVGQGYKANSQFSRRIFTNLSGFRPSEASTLTPVANYAVLNELLLFLGQNMSRVFPDGKPFEVSVNAEDIHKLADMRDRLLGEVEKVVGVDREGKSLKSDEHQELIKNSERWAQHILDVPYARVASYVHLYAAVVGGFMVAQQAASLLPWPVPSWITNHVQFGVFLFFSAMVTWVKRVIDGRTVLARTNNRTIVIGGLPVVHQTLEIFVSKLFALSKAATGVDVHGANPQDHMVHRFAHRVIRGTLIWMGIPDGRMGNLKRMESAYLMTAKQAMGIQNMGVGAEVQMVTRERDHNPNASYSDVVLQGPPVADDENLQKLAFGRYEALLQLVSGDVYFWNMAKKVSTLGLPPAFRWLWPWSWNMSRTQSGTRIATTASPMSPPPSDNAQLTVPASENAGGITAPGGVDMNPLWLNLKEIKGGRVPAPVIDHAQMVPVDVKRLTPYILDIKPVSAASVPNLMVN